MALAPIAVSMTAEQFLERERTSDTKHEYDNGYAVARVGASRAHNLIALTMASEIRSHLRAGPCRTYMSDMKLRIRDRQNDLFYYPDVMVCCEPNPSSEYYEEKPVLVIEVLSPSTETRDKLEKLAAYSRIDTLAEYLTIAQDRVEVNSYSLSGGETFLVQYQDGDTVTLSSIGLEISVRDIYQDVAGKLLL